MKHPEKWRETINPFELPYQNFTLTEVMGYPHAGNDVFQAKGIYENREVEVYIKAARQTSADILNEIRTINGLHNPLTPQIIDYDCKKEQFIVTLAKNGERLSMIVGDNSAGTALDYMYEYGQTLAKLHGAKGEFVAVKDRKFFHIPDKTYFDESLLFVYEYLIANEPKGICTCFCHGDFHYANILWENRHISAILDFELSGIGNKEFDIAWALILRPGQKFLNTKEELDLFLEGYVSFGTYQWESVKYYMVLIYTYFYKIGSEDSEYRMYIMNVFNEWCGGEKQAD